VPAGTSIISPSNIIVYVFFASSTSFEVTSTWNSSLGVFYTMYLYLQKKLDWPEVSPYTPNPATIIVLLGRNVMASQLLGEYPQPLFDTALNLKNWCRSPCPCKQSNFAPSIIFSLYSTSELPSLFYLWYKLIKFTGHYAIVAIYYSSYYIELSILTCIVTFYDSPPFTVCSRQHTPIILFRSDG
jgi:hypothetical protein